MTFPPMVPRSRFLRGVLERWASLVFACLAVSASAEGQVAGSDKGDFDRKGLALPGPGERVMVRIGPAWAPASLSEAPPPVARVEAAPSAGVLAEAEAQTVPANNNCSSATSISNIGEWAFDNSMATTDGLAHFACNFFGQSQITNDVWFKWTAPVTARFVAETCAGASFDTKMAVYLETTCPPGDAALLACNDDACSVQSRVTFDATAGQRYLVRIGSYPGSPGGAGSFRIRFQSGQSACPYGAQNCQARDPSDGFDATGYLLLDDFTTVANGTLTGLCFWGTYYNGITDCQASSADQFHIAYYFDNGGVPSFTPFVDFSPGQYTKIGPIATGNVIAGSFPEYAYSISHPGIQVSGNQCYWVSIENRLPPPPHGNCAWYWERGQGNMIAYRNTTRIAEDYAFCVSLALDPPMVCQQAVTPANDSCASATVMFCGSTQYGEENLFATTSSSDPPFTCRFGGPGQGFGTLWYRFTASATSARVSLCGNQTGDTLIAVYSGTCGSLTQIACNDDACGFKSQVCATGLTVGQTYYIQLASWDEASLGTYDIALDCPCPNPPANDACAGAAALAVPGSVTGSTRNAALDEGVPSCGFSLVSSPGVWYRVMGNGRRIRASLCGGATNYDTKISVLCGSCSLPYCVAANDDGEPPACGLASEAQWCSEDGREYLILVHGFNGAVGDFTLFLTTESQPCDGAAGCGPCPVVCPPNAVAESESCGGNTNGGCNVVPAAAQSVQCGQVICGTMRTTGVTRDTDWYEFSLNLPSVVTWTVESESPVEAMILSGQCPPQTLAAGTTARCGSAEAEALLQPGVYRAFVGAVFDGYPCGNSSNYTATLRCAPVGACCVADDCLRITGDECESLFGFYAGDGSSCPISYSIGTCAEGFEDISAEGTQVVLGDNEGVGVPIGFPFRFYGAEHTAVNLSSNGYLTFDAESAVAINRPIPDPSPPNALIAPLWDDLAPNQSSGIHFQTLGVAPNRRFVAQWKNVPQFLNTDSNTFQAVLFEGSNCIEFRYGAITPESPAGDYTIGVENHGGSAGTAVNAGTISAGSCVRLCPVLSPTGCVLPPCPGDANGDRAVTFADIGAVLTFWGMSGPLGDANGDGAVDFGDITSVLQHWGDTCPTH